MSKHSKSCADLLRGSWSLPGVHISTWFSKLFPYSKKLYPNKSYAKICNFSLPILLLLKCDKMCTIFSKIKQRIPCELIFILKLSGFCEKFRIDLRFWDSFWEEFGWYSNTCQNSFLGWRNSSPTIVGA